MTIFGWDASDFDHQRGMRASHITRAAEQGIRFFTHKITEGTHVTHQHAGEKLRAARDAGIPFLGAYIVVRTGPSIRAQVDHAIAQTDRQAPWWRTFGGWFWQVDLEKWSYDQVAVTRGPAMCAELERRGRHRAVLYAPKWAYGDSIPGSDPLWASNYGNNGVDDFRSLYPGDNSSRWAAYSDRAPAILQYGSRATIGGQRTCDANAYRGTEAEFGRLINAPKEDDVELTDQVDMTNPAGGRWSFGEILGKDSITVKAALGYAAAGGWQLQHDVVPLLPKLLAGQAALIAAHQGEDVDEAIRAELDRHRDLLVAELGGQLGPLLVAELGPALVAELGEAAGELSAEVVEAAVGRALARTSLTVAPEPA